MGKDDALEKTLATRPKEKINKKKVFLSQTGLPIANLSHLVLSPALMLKLIPHGSILPDNCLTEAIADNLDNVLKVTWVHGREKIYRNKINCVICDHVFMQQYGHVQLTVMNMHIKCKSFER